MPFVRLVTKPDWLSIKFVSWRISTDSDIIYLLQLYLLFSLRDAFSIYLYLLGFTVYKAGQNYAFFLYFQYKIS